MLISGAHLFFIGSVVHSCHSAWGLTTPCVCEAGVLPSRHEMAVIVFRTGNVFIDLYAVLKSAILLIYTFVLLVAEAAELVWLYPSVTLSLGLLVVVTRSFHT